MACEIRELLLSDWSDSKEAHRNAVSLMEGASGFNLRVARVAIRRTYAERAYCEATLKNHELEHGCAWTSANARDRDFSKLRGRESYSRLTSGATDNSD